MGLKSMLAALALGAAFGRAHGLELVAHRGASHQAPENTLAAVRLAWKESADAVEIDVRLSKDGKLVVIHDGDAKRVSGEKVRVHEKTLAELRKLDVGRWKGDQWAGERIPTLDEVLAALPAGRRLFVEIKGGPELVPEVAKAIWRSGKGPAQVVIIGFSFAAMEAAKKALPGHEVSWLVSRSRDKKSGKWKPAAEEMIEKARRTGLNGLGLNASGAIDAALVAKVHKAGLKLNVWTVDSHSTARQLQKLGVDYLTTNRPGWMREKLGLKQPEAGAGPGG